MAKSKKAGKAKVKVGIKEPALAIKKVEREIPPGPPPKKIRMLMSLANQDMAYQKGKTYLVPQEVRVPTARSWIASGAAEEVE